jgi:hypothetical protein
MALKIHVQNSEQFFNNMFSSLRVDAIHLRIIFRDFYSRDLVKFISDPSY